MNVPRPVLATAALTAVVVAVGIALRARRPASSGSAGFRQGPRHRRRTPASTGADVPLTSRPVPRSVAALTPAEQADSPMVHDG